METFIESRPLVENPDYREQRRERLAGLSEGMIDEPIVDVIDALNRLPQCFTLQCCYGHFVYPGQEDLQNLERLPETRIVTEVEYRIAYLAFCVEDSAPGRTLLEGLKTVASIDPDNVQFGCAEWFWEQQVDSYVLQVEPDRFKFQDKAFLGYEEALKIEKVRDAFFADLRKLLSL